MVDDFNRAYWYLFCICAKGKNWWGDGRLKGRNMEEDLYSGEKSVVRDEPNAGDYEPEVRFFRSLAAVAVVYGTAGVLLVPYGLLRFHQGQIEGDFKVNLFEGPLRMPDAQALWLFFSSLLGGGLGLALMIGAIGAVKLKSWSYTVLRAWAISSILLGAGGSYFWFRWLLPPWRETWAEVRGVDDSLFNFGGWMIGSFMAVFILIVISRPRVRQALERGGHIVEPPH